MIYTALSLMAGLTPIVTLTSCYLTALEVDHIKSERELPRVTDLGSQMPEILIFSIGFCIASALQLTLVVLRYVQVKTFHRAPLCPVTNAAGCCFGWLMVLGQMILTAVRHSDEAIVNYFGKAILFSTSCIYITIQSYISMTMIHYHNRAFAYFRGLLAILTLVTGVVFVTGLAVDELKELGFPEIAEIILLFLNVIFWISLTVDFHRNKLDLNTQQDKMKIRIRHRSGSGGADKQRVINYLHSIIEDGESSGSRTTKT